LKIIGNLAQGPPPRHTSIKLRLRPTTKTGDRIPYPRLYGELPPAAFGGEDDATASSLAAATTKEASG
jgi:hypothetical protein